MSGPLEPTVRRGSSPVLRASLLLVVAVSVLVCALEVPLLRQTYPQYTWVLSTLAVIGVIYVGTGAIAWDRRPSNRMGLYLCLAGFLTLIARLSAVQDPVLGTIGSFVAQAPIAAVLHLMLLFPSGRLQSRWDRILTIAGYVVTVGFQVALTLFRPADPSGALRIADRPDLSASLTRIQGIAAALVIIAAAALLIRKLLTQRAVHGERRARAAVYTVGVVSIVFLPFSAQVLAPLLGWSDITLFVWQVAALLVVPLVFTGGLLIGGYARTGQIEELGAWLGANDGDRLPLRQALADTLGDSSLQLLFRNPTDGRLIGTDGEDLAEPVIAPPLGAVAVEVRGTPSALILYDTSAVGDPALVESAGRVVALALERDRLTAELVAEREALRESRARIVEVGDLERRRFARDLHDLLQSRLVLAAMHAGAVNAQADIGTAAWESSERLRSDLEDAITELRRLVHGVMPALLVERGLPAAAQDVVDRCRIPARLSITDLDQQIPPLISTSVYFLLVEAMTNAVKHSRAGRLTITITGRDGAVCLEVTDDGVGGATMSGSGLRGMADRVEAIGGTFQLISRDGRGTSVLASLPCARHPASVG